MFQLGEGEERLGLFPKRSGELWIRPKASRSTFLWYSDRKPKHMLNIMIPVWGRARMELECIRIGEVPTERDRSFLQVLGNLGTRATSETLLITCTLVGGFVQWKPWKTIVYHQRSGPEPIFHVYPKWSF